MENKTYEISDETGAKVKAKSYTDLLLMIKNEQHLATAFARTDVALIFKNTEDDVNKLYVNQEQLSKVSPVFKAMFSSDFKEVVSGEVELPEKKMSTFMHFLRLALPGYFAEITGLMFI